MLAPEEFDRLTNQAHLVAAVQAGLADQAAGRTIDDEELEPRLDTHFGALTESKQMIRWTDRATSDWIAIGDYVARDNPSAARSWVERLRLEAIRSARIALRWT